MHQGFVVRDSRISAFTCEPDGIKKSASLQMSLAETGGSHRSETSVYARLRR